MRISSVQKKKSSYAWKSILYRRDLVCKGMRFYSRRWKPNYIWTDPWISYHPPRPPRPILQGDKLGKVN